MFGRGARRGSDRKWWQWGKAHAVVATAVAVALVVPTTGAVQAAADDLVFALIEVSKTANPAAPDALIPGEQVIFDIEVSCSSTQTDCISMKITDAMPVPLTLVSVSPGINYTVAVTGNSFVATFTTPLDEGGVGLPGRRARDHPGGRSGSQQTSMPRTTAPRSRTPLSSLSTTRTAMCRTRRTCC